MTAFFRQKKITIAPEAVEYILDMVENNTRDMRVECDRLAQFFGPDTVIGLESVEQYIYHSKEENVFTLFDKICERSLAGAAEVLDKILLSREAEAVQITSGLLHAVPQAGQPETHVGGELRDRRGVSQAAHLQQEKPEDLRRGQPPLFSG